MKKNIIVIISIFLISNNLFNQNSNAKEEYVKGEIFVKIKNAYSELDLTYNPKNGDTKTDLPNKFLKKYNIVQIRKPFEKLKDENLNNTYVIKFSEYKKTDDLIKDIKDLIFTDYVEKVPNYQLFFTPNDLGTLWHIPKIQGENAWDITQGSSSVVLAVVDDAVLLTHEDLSSKIWTNASEIPLNGIDDDGNGYIDDVNGWDAGDNDNNVNPPSASFSHGTHVAGIAAGATNNGIGIASIGFNVTIMPIKIADDATYSLNNAYDGVTYAIVNNADIISMSWGGYSYSITYQNIFNNAYAQGIVCVAAAANNNISTPAYPASYNHVISVAASDQNDIKAWFSNYGPTVDVVAPGVDIYSPVANSDNSYDFYDGTSMACPMVSGIIGLMLSKASYLTPDEVEDCLKNTCDDIYALNPTYIGQLGAGRVNAYEALKCIKPITAGFNANYLQACPGQAIQFSDVSVSINPITSWQWSFPGGSPASSTLQNPVVTYPTAGSYNVSLIVTNLDGSDTLVQTTYITIANPTATIGGTYTIFAGYTVNIPIYFTGTGPWDFTYYDGTSSFNISGVTSNPYFLSVSPIDTTQYTITSINDNFCSGTPSGIATVNIIPFSSTIGCYFTKVIGDALGNSASDFHFDPIEDEFVVIGKKDNSEIIMKLDGGGNEIWVRELQRNFNPTSIDKCPNGDYIFTSQPSGVDIYITRVDNNGNLIWTYEYDQGSEDNSKIIRGSGDEYYLSARANVGGTQDDLLVMKINGNGDVLWSKRYNDQDDQFYDLVSNNSGGFISAGGIHGGGTQWGSIVEWDEFGDAIQAKEISSSATNFCEFLKVIKATDGGYLTLGKFWNGTGNDGSIKKFDANMNLVWEKTILLNNGLTYTDGGLMSLAQDNSGAVYIAVRKISPATPFIIKFDVNGNHVWTKYVPGSTYIRMKNTNSFPNDNMVIFGTYTTIFGNTDVFLARTDTSLNSCIVTNTTIDLSNRTFIINDWTYTINNITYTKIPESVTTLLISYNDSDLCDPCLVCDLHADFSFQNGCTSDSVYFYDESTDDLANIVYYEWHFGDGNSVIGIQNPSHIYNAPGVYDVTLIISNDGTPLCYDTITKQIIIYDSLTINLTPNDTTICLYQSIQLNVNAFCGTEPYTYAWSPVIGLSDPNIANPIASPTNTTTYIVYVTDNLGNIIQDSITIIVDTLCCSPQANFTFPNPVCENNSVNFINSSVSLYPSASYSWNFGSTSIPSVYFGETPPSVIFPGTGSYTITLIMVDSCGIDTFSSIISVLPGPSANAGNDTILCSQDTIKLGKNIIGPGISYSWTPIDNIVNPNSPNPDAYILNPIEYVVEVTDNTTGCSKKDTIQISIVPEIIDLIEDENICKGDTTILNSYYPDANSYAWNTGSINDSIVVTDSGMYNVSITIGSCVRTDSAYISYREALNYSIGSDTIACNGDSVIISVNIFGVNYSWNTGATTPSIIVSEPGNYQVNVNNGCETVVRSKNIEFNDCECIYEIPNVFTPDGDDYNNVFKIKLNREKSCIIDLLEIYNRWGTKIYESTQNEWPGVNSKGNPVSQGTYYYIVRINKKQYTGYVTLLKGVK